MDAIWQALSREAATASDHLAIGITALGRANYAQPAYYGQAFFALTTGIERSAKLALIIDHFLTQGKFPLISEIREYGHKIRDLLERMDEVASRYNLSERLPRLAIHDQIIAILSDFATNRTRYYNLDLITSNSSSKSQNDPISAWYQKVMIPMIKEYSLNHQMEKRGYNAHIIDELINGKASVSYRSETGENINSVYGASMQKAIADITIPYVRLHVMQIVRFIGCLLSALGYSAQEKGLEVIPCMADFFGIYNNDDKYFKTRKTWSVYRL